MVRKSKSEQIRGGREDSMGRLVQSAIALLGTVPMNALRIDDIAEHAGLASGHVLVHRYFGSRIDLMSAVAHELARQLTRDLGASLELSRSETSVALDILKVVANNVPLIRKRALVVNELMLHGSDPSTHSADMREVLATLQSAFEMIQMSPRAARAASLNMFTLISAEATLSEWNGANVSEREDLRNMTLLELNYANDIAKQLGWE